MKDHFKCLFILPQNKKQSNQDYFIASERFPVSAHFEYGHVSALAYLKHSPKNDFPSIIILEDALGFEKNLEFITEYRAQFYLFNIDTLLFNCKLNPSTPQQCTKQYPEIISDTLPLPFNKQVFMKNVFPLLTVYMV